MFGVFQLLDKLFDKYLWKLKPINKRLGVPVFLGVWQGNLRSSYAGGQDYPVTVTIRQTWKEISVCSDFEKSNSACDFAVVNPDASFGIMIRFSYKNMSRDETVEQSEHSGLNELYLKEPNRKGVYQVLSGAYYNNRGNKGSIELKRIN